MLVKRIVTNTLSRPSVAINGDNPWNIQVLESGSISGLRTGRSVWASPTLIVTGILHPWMACFDTSTLPVLKTVKFPG